MLLNNPMTEWDTFLSLPIVDYLWVTRKKYRKAIAVGCQKIKIIENLLAL